MARSAVTPAREGLSLLDALAGFSDEQLLGLLKARPDLATPPPKDLTSLVVRASSWTSVNACVVTLNQVSQQLLDALCLLPQPTTASALARLLDVQVDADELNAALKRLVDLALVFRQGMELRVHPQVESRTNPAGLGPPASSVLAAQTATALEAMARRLSLKAGRNKHENLSSLVLGLNDPAVVKAALKGGPTGTMELAAQLAEHPVGTVSSGTYYLRPTSPLGWMADRGLVVAIDWETVVMPREVGLALRGGRPFPDFSLRPPAVRWRTVDAGSVNRAGIEQAQRVVADISTILDNWQETPAKLLKAGGLGVREVRRAAAAVGRSEIEAARLIELAAVAGLAGWDAATDVALPRPAYDEWTNLGLVERWMTVVTAWSTAELHVNLAGAMGTNKKPIPPLLDRWPEEPGCRRRQLVLAALLEGGAAQAADAETLVARVTWDAPLIWTGGPARPPLLVSWVREEAEMLGLCSSGALSSLGQAVVSGHFDQAMAELAAHTPVITSQFVIQADLTAVATGPLAKAVRSELELMADLESSGAATVYRFNEQTLRRAYDAGRTAVQIVGFLNDHATKGVPQPLTYLVEDVARRHGRVRVGSATCYLRSDDPSLMAEILVARRAAKLELRQLAPTVLVSSATAETVIATLRDGGYLPAEEDGTGGLVVRRKEVARANAGHGPTRGARLDAAGELTKKLEAQLAKFLSPEQIAALRHDDGAPTPIRQEPPKQPSRPGDPDLEALVRRLRPPHLRSVPDSRPPSPPAPKVNGTGAINSYRTSAHLSQLPLLDDGSGRPREIAKSQVDILELLELCLDEEWMLRLEYTNQQGRSHQINAAVFNIGTKQVTVGTLPGYGTRILTISRITWARALTEAEEEAL